MLLNVTHPDNICHATTIGDSKGIVNSSSDNQTGTQAAQPLASGANYTRWFEVKGRYATILLHYVKGGETNMSGIGFVIFGSDAVVQRSNDITIGVAATVTAINTNNRITGRSYPLNESSMNDIAFGTATYTADKTVAIPVHLGVSNRATPATVPVALTAAAFPGRYARIVFGITGTPNSTTVVDIDIAWAD